MNILMILEGTFPPDRRVENEINALIDAGHNVHLFCVRHSLKKPNNEFGRQLIIHRIYMPRILFKKVKVSVLKFNFYNSYWKMRIIRQSNKIPIQFNVIHIHDLPLSKLGIKLAHYFKSYLIVDLHENYPAAIKVWKHTKGFLGKYFFQVNMWKNYEKEIVEIADRIIVVIDEAKSRFEQNIQNKVVVVSNTQEINSLPTKLERETGHKLKYVYLGGIGPHRGIEAVIDYFNHSQIFDSFSKFSIIGSGTGKENLKRKVYDLGISDKINILGFLPQDEALKIVNEHDIGIIPHIRSEHTNTTIPHKLFQYMALGLPVIVSNCLPLIKIVEETNCGWVFESGNQNSFIDVINIITKNKKSVKEKGINGRNAVEKIYNWSIDAKRLVNMYSHLEKEKRN